MASTADNLMLNAKGFAMSAETLYLTSDPKHDLTILHLVCVSLELSLKAWIKHRGGTEKDLRKIGHNLDLAYSESVRLGLGDQAGRLRQAIDSVTAINAADCTRYFPDNEGFETLTPQSLVDAARGVAMAVEADVWPPAQAAL